MRINITSGDCLNDILIKKYKDELFIPFREALINGEYDSIDFTDEFIEKRIKALKTSKEEYLNKMWPFIDLLNNLNKYDEIVLWFGDEPFCRINRQFVLKCLRLNKFNGKVILNIVDEETGSIIKGKD